MASHDHRSWAQRFVLGFNGLLVIACLTAAAGLSAVESAAESIKRVSLGASLTPPPTPDQPENFLLVGLDSASGLAANDPVHDGRTGGPPRSDVIMIIHVDPRTQKVSVLSIPRDSFVPIAPSGEKDKINAAITLPGGAENLIQTIKDDFGIPISHYIAVDFHGVEDVVSVLGGIPIELTTPIRDRTTGLLQETTGCVTLSPPQALAYVRSRHLQYLDPTTHRWTTDPTSDLGRISRQQSLLVDVAQRAIDQGARNPATALDLLRAGLPAVTMDSSLTIGQLLSFADALQGLTPQSIGKFQLPTTSGGNASDSYQVVQWTQAAPMLDIFRGFGPPPPSSTTNPTTAPGTQAAPTTTPVGFVPVDDTSPAALACQ